MRGREEVTKSYVSALPSAEQYEQSLMHRDVVNYVLVTSTGFVITTSVDGHVKFWKRVDDSLKFLKHLRAHLGAIVSVDVDYRGELLATAAVDKGLKIFDVIGFEFLPNAICWVYPMNSHVYLLACSDKESQNIHLFDGKSGVQSPLFTISTVHSAPVHIMKYNSVDDVIVSVDQKGRIEYWRPESGEPKFSDLSDQLWLYKSETDLYIFQKEKVVPGSLQFSRDFTKFSVFSLMDRQIRIFNFYTGKLIKQYNEDLSVVINNRQNSESSQGLSDMEFGRRLAFEKEVESEKYGQRLTANTIFDDSGNFIIYATLLGIKIININTNKVVRILGRSENLRFMRLALYQTPPDKRMFITLAMAASDNATLKKSEIAYPALFCTAYKKNRFYIFTNKEPDYVGGVNRDVFNEKPSREEQTVAAQGRLAVNSGGGSSAVIHTSFGDINIRLFPGYAPKTVENFVGLAKNDYYNNVIFHRVIKNFIIQTGDPNGDGTGGTSLWGKNFEDEFHSSLKHNKPYMLCMANIGPNTNGSQFFITTVPTPWLDNKHTIFGVATGGHDVIHKIENLKTDKLEMPLEVVKILSIDIR